jgi:hypothetical protein
VGGIAHGNIGLVLIFVMKRHGVAFRVNVTEGSIFGLSRGRGKGNVDRQSEGGGVGVIVGKVARENSIRDGKCSVYRGRYGGGRSWY